MNQGKTVFAQMMSFLSNYEFNKCVDNLCLSMSPWARFRKSKGAVKMHTQLDLRGSIASFSHAQRFYDGSGRYIGRVENNRFYDGSGRNIGRIDKDRVYDGSGRNLGRIDNNRLYDAQGRSIGRVDGNRLFDASGRHIGRIDGERIYDGSGRYMDRAEGVGQREIVLFWQCESMPFSTPIRIQGYNLGVQLGVQKKLTPSISTY
jgi:sporulation protein YlmC with PRC-barrel domain